MNVLLLSGHSIEEHDQVKLLTSIGADVFSIGGYIDPHAPHDPKRPSVPEAAFHPDLKKVVDDLDTTNNLEAAKRDTPDELIDWADTIIVSAFEHTWLVPQWKRLRRKRVIWRTIGQSVEYSERMMRPFHDAGLQIVRYSPKERNIPGFAGEDALIRFWKDPGEWNGWTGEDAVVGNVTQHLLQRDPYTNYDFWSEATQGLPVQPAGPGSEAIGGLGELGYDDMRAYLRRIRAYLYTGTQPASYTLGLIEAMMTGVPIVSIGPAHMGIFPYGPGLFEGHELTSSDWYQGVADDPREANNLLQMILANVSFAREVSESMRAIAIRLFGYETIRDQWAAFLGVGVLVPA